MSVIVWLLDGLADLTAPYWLTLQALAAMITEAGAGTALIGSFLLLLSLDFLRASKGLFVPVARVLSVGFTLFVVASFVYGDFLAAPAKAAYSAIVARSDTVAPNVVVLTTLGAAGAGAFFMTSWRQAPRTMSQKSASTRVFASMRRAAPSAIAARAPAIDAAERLQLRQMSHNPKKAVSAVRPAVRAMAAVRPIPRHGQRGARFGRV
ncbi:MAG: hypothetical protein JNL06_19140 [Alphaproteobacteria bacterium]|nr:hypothetical protein [Alphaproteobacteria bacterium]